MRRSHVRPTIASVLIALSAATPGLAQGGVCPGLDATEAGVLQPQVADPDFGSAVSLSGDWSFIGLRDVAQDVGELSFFERTGTGWLPRTTSATSGRATAVDGDLAFSGERAFMVGASAWERSGSAWSVVQLASAGLLDNHDDFGYAVALDGETAAGSAPSLAGPLGIGQGGVVVFDRTGGVWVERYTAWGSSGVGVGHDIDLDGRWLIATGSTAILFDLGPQSYTTKVFNPGPGAVTAVSVAGDTLALGAPSPGKGTVYLFDFDGSTWIRGPELSPADLTAGAQFGKSVDLDGDRLIVGAPNLKQSPGTMDGGFYVYERVGTTWIEVGRYFEPSPAAVLLGRDVSLDGDRAVVGALGEARVFDLEVTLPPTPFCTAGTTASGCQARISGAGVASASAATGFLVRVTGSEGQKDGTVYFGTLGDQANSWGNGTSFQCVVPPVTRTGIATGAGTLGNCDGGFQLDFNAWMAAHPASAPQPGTTTFMQAWFRDPQNTSNQSTSLSDALVFTVCQ